MIRQAIKQTGQTGTWAHATVEDVVGTNVSVRLSGNGNRLTTLIQPNLSLSVGDKVGLDFSAGFPPKIISLLTVSPSVMVNLQTSTAVIPEPDETTLNFLTYGIGAKVRHCINISIGTSWESLRFNQLLYDTDTLFKTTKPDRFTIHTPGVYLLLARITLGAVLSSSVRYELEFYSSSADDALPCDMDTPLVGCNQNSSSFPMTSYNHYKVLGLHGMALLEEGDAIQFRVKTNTGSTRIIQTSVMAWMACQLLGPAEEGALVYTPPPEGG
jgi:hypothetical protein